MAEVRIRPLHNPVAQLPDLSRRNLNFDPSTLNGDEPGWRKDEYRQVLPTESPGEPVRDGSWDTARSICAAYGFVDDSIVHAIYDPDEPLANRNMLLEVHFWRFFIYAPVRVGEVFDGAHKKAIRTCAFGDGTIARSRVTSRWDRSTTRSGGRTLGSVGFCIHAISKAAPIRAPILRIGLRCSDEESRCNSRSAPAEGWHNSPRRRFLNESLARPWMNST